jgi:hypothetical protein
LGAQPHKPGHRVLKKLPVAWAKITLAGKVVLVKNDPVLQTAAATDGKMPTNKTLSTEITFGAGEGPLGLGGGQFFYRRFQDVA